MKKTLLDILRYALCFSAASVAFALEPKPLASVPKSTREVAASFWVKFDKVPQKNDGARANAAAKAAATFGIFDVFADANGAINVRLFATPTDLCNDLVMDGKVKAKTGRWYHVAFFYSMDQRRYMIYVDGKFQSENDKLILPEIGFAAEKLALAKGITVQDFRLYDGALDSEELIPEQFIVDPTADARTPKNGERTIAAMRRANKVSANIARIRSEGEALKKAGKGFVGGPVTIFVTPPTSQHVYLPYDWPEYGKLTDTIEVVAAPGEFESVSLIAFPLQATPEFTFKHDDLRSGANVIKGDTVDFKLLKRWFRAGGAWYSYHVDLRMRTLTPALLINDDKLVKVDELRRKNYLLMHYPTGDEYIDVSKFTYDRQWLSDSEMRYFYDAPTLQPMNLSEPGRNQQYYMTYNIPKGTAPGLYEGTLRLMNGATEIGKMSVKLRVLPFELPAPAAYDDTDKPYLSHVNSLSHGRLGLKNALDFNMHHVTGIANDSTILAAVKEIGYPTDIIFSSLGRNDVTFGAPNELMTDAHRERMKQMTLRPFLEYEAFLEKELGKKDFLVYHCFSSESGWYNTIAARPDELSTYLIPHRTRLFSHGMTESIQRYSPSIYDMNSATGIKREIADIWHAVDGKAITYADPFPGPESPGLMRRALGLDLWKRARYDGHMMHGYIGNQYNEFCKYPGGDGDYRDFSMAFKHRDGVMNKPAMIGYREAYDDVRYGTLLKRNAQAAMKSADPLIQKEAKRQLAWLEHFDGAAGDFDEFRAGAQWRIVQLQKLIAERQGK